MQRNSFLLPSSLGLAVHLLTAGSLLFPVAAPAAAPLDVEDLSRLELVKTTALSPDGRTVLFVTEEPGASPRAFPISVLWQVPTESGPADGGEAQRLGPGSMPRWAADGSAFFFLAPDEGHSQVWKRAHDASPDAAPDAQPERLTQAPLGVQDFGVSPDGRQLAYIALDPQSMPSGEPRVESSVHPRSRLHLLDLAGEDGVTTDRVLTPPDVSVKFAPWFPEGSLSWSPDSRQIAFAVEPEASVFDNSNTDLWVVSVADPADGLRPLVVRPGMDMRPQWSPDGSSIAFVTSDGLVDYNADSRVAVVPAEGGEPRAVDRLEMGILDGPRFFCWDPDSRHLWLSTATGVTAQLFRLDVETGAAEAFTSGRKVHAGFSVAFDAGSGSGAGRMACLITDLASPWDVFVSPLDRFEPRRITRRNAWLEGHALGATEVVRWTAPDGLELEGLLLLPPGFGAGEAPERPLPLLVVLHGGGPSGVAAVSFETTIPDTFPAGPFPLQVFAGRGHAVFLPNYRGSGGYGERFRRRVEGALGSTEVADVVSGVDHLIARGVADGDRMGVMGFSHGGYLTAVTVAATDRFDAAAVFAGPVDLAAKYGETPELRLYNESYLGGAPWEVPEAYQRSSPIRSAHRITTPTLILQGERDPLVKVGQARQLYTVLSRRGTPVELVLYPRQGHGIHEPDLMEDARRRVVEWFERWLR